MHEVEGSSPFETTIIQEIRYKKPYFLYFFMRKMISLCEIWGRIGEEISSIPFNI
mgnify:CR=1 FL=1